MTTPDTDSAKNGAGGERPKRATPERTSPIRTGSQMAADTGPPSGYAAKPLGDTAPVGGSAINESVADAVKMANDVLADTVAQGRVAAEQLRKGTYNMRDVPVDVEVLGVRMLRLARELSETTFNILEQLLRQATRVPSQLPTPQTGKVPPFPQTRRSSSDAPPSSTPAQPGAGTQGPPALALQVRFDTKAKAKAHPAYLARPERPTSPDELSVTPLQPSSGKAKPIDAVTFSVDVGGTLIATIKIPARQPAGIYAGMVSAKTQALPLGMIAIEIVG